MKLCATLLLLIPVALAGCATTTRYPAETVTHAGRDTYRVAAAPDMLLGGALFTWPVTGSVMVPFGAKIDKSRSKGIDIRVYEGENVRASRSGRVVFSDDHFKGFGKTLILDHGDKFQTVYAYNSDILVRVGDAVKQKDVIARVGRTGRAKEPCLHFEIRKDGEPQNPLYYLK